MINMKAIELTESHKKKLLEMCKVLFPEYENIFLENPKTVGILESYYLTFIKNINTYFYIHWFEFCMTHLTEKLGTNYGVSYYEMMHNYHPVDYLYKEFKKLK